MGNLIKIAALLFIGVILALTGCGPSQQPATTQTTDPYAGRPVKSISTLIDRYTKTLDWCHSNNLIAFEQYGADGYVDIYVLDPQDSKKTPLTDGNTLCPQKNNGNAAWHPSGEYIVFTAEKESNPESLKRQATPGSGFNCDLWLATADGNAFYPLTNYPIHTRAVIHPHFG